MKRVRILIVEDERLIALNIKQVLENAGYEVGEIADSYVSALMRIAEQQPDLAILDIRLKGEKSGIDLANKLHHDLDIPFIYLTSHFDEDTVANAKATLPRAYLTKPVRDRDVTLAVEMALLNHRNGTNGQTKVGGEAAKPAELESFLLKQAIFLKSGTVYHKVDIADIQWIKGEGSYTSVMTANGKHVVRANLRDFEMLCQREEMLQLHRSYIVNLEQVEEIRSKSVVVAGEELPLSPKLRQVLLDGIQRIR